LHCKYYVLDLNWDTHVLNAIMQEAAMTHHQHTRHVAFKAMLNWSPKALPFFQDTLRISVEERLTASEALQHPFIRMHAEYICKQQQRQQQQQQQPVPV